MYGAFFLHTLPISLNGMSWTHLYVLETLNPSDLVSIFEFKSQDHWSVNYSKVQYIYTHSNEIHNVVALIKCLLVLCCQLYMFRTVTVHPQELLCGYCMCRLWYVLIRPAGTTFEEVLPQALYQLDVSDSGFLTMYHSLHIQYLQRSSWGWTVTVRNM